MGHGGKICFENKNIEVNTTVKKPWYMVGICVAMR